MNGNDQWKMIAPRPMIFTSIHLKVNPLSDFGEGTGERRGRPAPPLFPPATAWRRDLPN